MFLTLLGGALVLLALSLFYRAKRRRLGIRDEPPGAGSEPEVQAARDVFGSRE